MGDVALLTPRTGLIYGSYETSFADRVAVSIFHLVRPMTNGTISLPRCHVLARAPSVIQRPYHLAWDGLRPVCGGVVFSKLSKLLNQEDALSVPCLKHFRNYCGPIKDRDVWSSLGENHEKACRFDLHPLQNFLQR